MSNLKRFPLKYIRDFIKKDYKLRECCYICSATDTLELHHLYSVSDLFTTWCKHQKIKEITTEEEIKLARVQFSLDCAAELANENLFTLCSKHHKQLHSIYGQAYSTRLAPKVKNWLDIQKAKNE